MKVQFEEETFHAMKMLDYVNERGGRVILEPIAEVPAEWNGVLNVYEETLKHEEKVTALINECVNVAIEEKDHATVNFLQWFVDEQVEEEATVGEILDQLKMFEGKGHGLYMMDKEFKTRTFTAPAE
jgi:ferritin